MLALARRSRFDYRKTMDAESHDAPIAGIAAAIAEPARARMLCRLLDGHARTSTELAAIAGVTASTASVHLAKLMERGLVKVSPQGRHRYYSLRDVQVAAALEALTVVAGEPRACFVPGTPERLRVARTCYDHMAGTLAVRLHDSLFALRWLSRGEDDYNLTRAGVAGLRDVVGVDIEAARTSRRRFACACLDWSERRPHLAGALGAGVLQAALDRKWIVRDLDSRALQVTRAGHHAFRERFGIEL